MSADPHPDLERDETRLLARGLGYTRQATRALPGEPEALSEADQELVTRQARERAENDRRHALRMQLERVRRELTHHEAQARHCTRQIQRLQRALGR